MQGLGCSESDCLQRLANAADNRAIACLSWPPLASFDGRTPAAANHRHHPHPSHKEWGETEYTAQSGEDPLEYTLTETGSAVSGHTEMAALQEPGGSVQEDDLLESTQLLSDASGDGVESPTSDASGPAHKGLQACFPEPTGAAAGARVPCRLCIGSTCVGKQWLWGVQVGAYVCSPAHHADPKSPENGSKNPN